MTPAKTVTVLHIRCLVLDCPGTWRIDHLEPGRSFGPWTCDECGRTIAGTRTADGADIEPGPERSTRTEVLLVLDPRARVVLVTRGMRRLVPETDEYNPTYFHEEHTCPENYFRSTQAVLAVWPDGEVDADPHGVGAVLAWRDDPGDDSAGEWAAEVLRLRAELRQAQARLVAEVERCPPGCTDPHGEAP